ncbi:hypothetical protein HGRIS_011058 [Hohenbuehelia grisea]|uniref:Fungal N-terminal domain-containing protein n=1 Tax=Hohenbuehelia grisea TaxID=104357 RepID=A0ABR3IYS4_9AGAR
MDPLSLGASILAFVDAAQKLKETFDKVGQNKLKSRQLVSDAIRGLIDLENLLHNSRNIVGAEADELRDSLDLLRGDLETVQRRCSKFFSTQERGSLSTIKLHVKGWLKRGDVEEEIAGLEKHIRSSYYRFLVLTSTSTQVTALRTEQRLVVHHQEHSEQLTRLETAFERMVINNGATNPLPLSNVSNTDHDAVEMQFLRLQLQKVINSARDQQSTWAGVIEAPRQTFSDGKPRAMSFRGSTYTTVFEDALSQACSAVQTFRDSSNGSSLQERANIMNRLAFTLHHLGLRLQAASLAGLSSDLFRILYQGHNSDQYLRLYASTTYLFGNIGMPYPGAIIFLEEAVNIWKYLYDTYSTPFDLMNLLAALRCYSQLLVLNQRPEEALEYSQQTLVLHREFCSSSDGQPGREGTTVTWLASGEASVVFSSDREFVQPSELALDEAMTLWSLASGFAGVGRYAEARVAGLDALSCLQALVLTDEWYSPQRKQLLPWRTDVASWVSIARSPTTTTATIVEENDETSSY